MTPHGPDTWDVWRNVVTRYTGDEGLMARLYKELEDHYSEPHRYYHNWVHIQALLQLYDLYKNMLINPDVVLFSIFYHDMIYTPGKGDNEYHSAQVAKNALEQLGVPAAAIEEVQGYINATKDHKLPPSAGTDLKFFIDFDLSILATERETYKTYLLHVRKEYSYLSDEHFAWGRKAFVLNMLSKEHIFYTESFRPKEETARKNMQWELEISPGIFSAR
jgi:predicted metal-dependent HD superfamily phosphohydrolase